MKQPLISVIIPTYNSSKTIGRAIKSMCNQTWNNLEILVIDDNSTDDTERTVTELIKQDKRIQYYKLPFQDPFRVNKRGRNINAGYMARNFGFEKVKGDYITFQDADDASLLNRIEAQFALLTEYNAMHVTLDWQRLTSENLGKKLDVHRIRIDHPDCCISKEEIVALAKQTKGAIVSLLGKLNPLIPFEFKRLRVIHKLFFNSLAPYPGSGNSPLFKKEVIDQVKFRKLSNRIWPSFVGRGADRDFNFQVAETFKNSFIFKIPLYLWSQESTNNVYTDYGKYLE